MILIWRTIVALGIPVLAVAPVIAQPAPFLDGTVNIKHGIDDTLVQLCRLPDAGSVWGELF